MDAAELIGIIIAALGIIGTIIGTSIRTASKFAVMAKDLEDMEDELEKLAAHNAKQHEELYNSRNGMNEAITRLSTLIEVMANKQESMDAKIDLLLQRGVK